MFGLIGVVLMVLGVWQFRSSAEPDDAVIVPVTVVGHERKRLGKGGNNMVTGAVVEYDHPGSGTRERMEPRSFSKNPPALGDRVELAYKPTIDRIRLVDPAQRRRALLVIVGMGVAMTVVQFLIWFR